MFKHFMDVANNFQQEEDKEETKNGEEKKEGCCGFKGFEEFAKHRKNWGEKRAVIIRKPEGVLMGEPGQVVLAEVEVQNQTKWPWKRGCFVGLVKNDLWEEGKCPLNVKDFPID